MPYRSAVALATVALALAAPPPSSAQTTPPLMSPFPRVVMSGRSFEDGTRVTRLTVRGPEGARVEASCRGHGCPFRARAVPIRFGGAGFGEFPDLLRPNSLVEVFVTSPNTIGRHVRFRIRHKRAPGRRNRCLLEGYPRPILCP